MACSRGSGVKSILLVEGNVERVQARHLAHLDDQRRRVRQRRRAMGEVPDDACAEREGEQQGAERQRVSHAGTLAHPMATTFSHIDLACAPLYGAPQDRGPRAQAHPPAPACRRCLSRQPRHQRSPVLREGHHRHHYLRRNERRPAHGRAWARPALARHAAGVRRSPTAPPRRSCARSRSARTIARWWTRPPSGGYGTLYGPNVRRERATSPLGEGKIAGEEYLAYDDDGSGRAERDA